MAGEKRQIFCGMQTLLDQKWVPDMAVLVEEGVIKAVIQREMIKHHLPAEQYEFPADAYLIPGLIDLHVHGIQGADVMDGESQALETISMALAQQGVTGFLATTMTCADEVLEKALTVIANAENEKGAAILGIHLEGPFIAKDKVGAQNEHYTQLPNIEVFKHWQKLANDKIKLVTLAPELPQALPFIKELKTMNVVASIGHTNADFHETNEAIKAGCTQATHLFNAMRGLQQRQPGAVGALLLSDQVMAELICDNTHLHAAIIDISFKLKGKDKLLLVTDAMRATCLGDGDFELGGQQVTVSKGRATLANGQLAGSTLCMPKAIQNMVQASHCALEEAVYMASYNPARVLGLNDSKGSIAVGKHADLVVLNADFEVLMTMRQGNIVYQAA